ncbi:unnamed protein product [Schistosoma turkestanicum]|nr:unnamed protein product [Schistosoma turkestanicum]
MGGRSGKFVVPHTVEKTGDSPCKPDANEQAKTLDCEQPVQLSDDKLENGHKDKYSTGEENHEQANGDVTTSDIPQNGDAKRSKKGNPIARILRRISRKGSNLKKHSTDKSDEKPEDTSNDEKKEVNTTDTTETQPECTANIADNLVQDVIISATQTRLEEIQVCEVKPYEESPNDIETKNNTQESLSEVETVHVNSCVNESYVNGESVDECTEKSEDVLVNGVHTYEEVNGVDCNNTNIYVDDNVIHSKLANLELVNGHSEVNGFHCETTNSVVVANDY